MFERKGSHRNIDRQTGGWWRSLAALMIAATALCTMFVPVASAQSAPKNGLYVYVCLPGNIGGASTIHHARASQES